MSNTLLEANTNINKTQSLPQGTLCWSTRSSLLIVEWSQMYFPCLSRNLKSCLSSPCLEISSVLWELALIHSQAKPVTEGHRWILEVIFLHSHESGQKATCKQYTIYNQSVSPAPPLAFTLSF